MHIFFSGIGGAAIGPLALIAKKAGYEVSGSDKQDSSYLRYLRDRGINIHVGQDYEQIESLHKTKAIDWFVYSSAVIIENPNAPELTFCHVYDIRATKRDELLNKIIEDKELKLIAIAGTQGKSTTTAMVIWLLKKLGVPVSYSVGAKISYGEMGEYEKGSEYFAYECDEFDHNFLHFKPHLSLISGLSWDHHEIFPTRDSYKQAFHKFIEQSKKTILWQHDMSYLGLQTSKAVTSLDNKIPDIQRLTLPGSYNRENAWVAIAGVADLTDAPKEQLIELMNQFPGLQRRMEEIIPNLYSDYAHTPEKIRGCMSTAAEIAKRTNQDLVIIYEPLTNRRQHYMIDDYGDCFEGAKKVYWLPSYLARERADQTILTPTELIAHLDHPKVAEASEKGDDLKSKIKEHLHHGDMVVAMSGGGGDSLDEWLRKNFSIVLDAA